MPNQSTDKESPPPDLGYVAFPDISILDMPPPEGIGERFERKFKENPFVPIGLAATIAVLSVGLSTLYTGNTRLSQKMMRLRVAAQGFTVFALLAGVFYQARTGETPEHIRKMKRQQALAQLDLK